MKKVRVFIITHRKTIEGLTSRNTSIQNVQLCKKLDLVMKIALILIIKFNSYIIQGAINLNFVKNIIFLENLLPILMMRQHSNLYAHLINYALLLIMINK